MNLKTLQETPPWDWPSDAGERFQRILNDPRASESDRVIAAELAGDLTVMNDELANSLTKIIGNPKEPDRLRGKAAIALGGVLEETDIDGFEDPMDDPPITEDTFHNIQRTLRTVFFDDSVAKDVRRRVLEASVRAPEDWHPDAIKVAYSSGDRDWILTAVFSMHYVRAFDVQILEALKNPDPQIHYQAVEAAGHWGVEGAWPHVLAIVKDARPPKHLLIAAIGAVGSIRPAEARKNLEDLAESEDEEIAQAADEAIHMAELPAGGDDDDDEDGEINWVN